MLTQGWRRDQHLVPVFGAMAHRVAGEFQAPQVAPPGEALHQLLAVVQTVVGGDELREAGELAELRQAVEMVTGNVQHLQRTLKTEMQR